VFGTNIERINIVRDIMEDVETDDSQELGSQRANFELHNDTVLINVQQKQYEHETNRMNGDVGPLQPLDPDCVRESLELSHAFRTLVTEIRLLSLPDSLQDIIKSADIHSINISSANCTSAINNLKAFLEDYTRCEWDWWPLPPRMQDVKWAEKRIEWKVSKCIPIPTSLNTETLFTLVLRAIPLSERIG